MKLGTKIFFCVIVCFSGIFLVGGYSLISYVYKAAIDREIDMAAILAPDGKMLYSEFPPDTKFEELLLDRKEKEVDYQFQNVGGRTHVIFTGKVVQNGAEGKIAPESGYALRIQDNGCGIPENEIKRITEAFYMVDKSRSRKQHIFLARINSKQWRSGVCICRSVLGKGYVAHRISVELLDSDREYCAVRGLPSNEQVFSVSVHHLSCQWCGG